MDVLKSFNLAGFSESVGNLTSPKQLFILLGCVAIFLYGMSIGKTRALMSLLAIYVALTLTNLFPFLDSITDAVPESLEPYMIKVSLFLVIYVCAFFTLYRSSLKRLSMGEMGIPKVMLVSLLQVGFTASVVASFIPEAIAENSLRIAYPFIGTPISLFCWSLVSLVILPLMKERR